LNKYLSQIRKNYKIVLPRFKSLVIGGSGRLGLFHGMIFVFFLRLTQLVMGLASTYFLARSMSKDTFGEYNMILNIVGIAGMTALTGLNNSLMQAVARGFIGTYRATVPVAFRSSFLGSLGLLMVSCWYFMDSQKQIALGCLVAAVLFPMAYGLTQWKALSLGQERFNELLLHDGGCSVLTYALVIGSTLLWPGDYLYTIVVMFLVPAVYNLVITILKYRKIPIDAAIEQQNVRYGIRTSFYSGLGAIGANLDRVLVFSLMSPSALALFVAAGRIPDLLSSAIQDIAAVLAPRLAKHESYTKRVDNIFMAMSLGYGVIVFAFAFLVIPWIVPTLFGANYSDAVPYAQALTCSVMVGTLSSLRFRFVRSRIDERGYRDVMLISSIVRLGAFVALVPPFGIVGAVGAVFIYRVSLALIVRTVIKRHYAM
jgi:O-antigen/teichoic acid export membrane protein